jgi:polar amino acid transport system substrate-binding protein
VAIPDQEVRAQGTAVGTIRLVVPFTPGGTIMIMRRILLTALVLVLTAGCASPLIGPTAEERQALAPAGKLRVGVYLGSPTSWVKGAAGEDRGLSVEIGKELAKRLDVPYEQVEFARAAAALDALKAGQVDFTITNATPARARDMNFTQPLLALELGYIAIPGSRVALIADVDRPGVRVGVSEGSTSQTTLARELTSATVVAAPSLKLAADMLSKGQLDTFATNKAILFEMSDQLPGSRVLDGRWGLEQLAIAIPKGREAALPFLRRFADEVNSSGRVKQAAERAGLRGTLPATR